MKRINHRHCFCTGAVKFEPSLLFKAWRCSSLLVDLCSHRMQITFQQLRVLHKTSAWMQHNGKCLGIINVIRSSVVCFLCWTCAWFMSLSKNKQTKKTNKQKGIESRMIKKQQSTWKFGGIIEHGKQTLHSSCALYTVTRRNWTTELVVRCQIAAVCILVTAWKHCFTQVLHLLKHQPTITLYHVDAARYV